VEGITGDRVEVRSAAWLWCGEPAVVGWVIWGESPRMESMGGNDRTGVEANHVPFVWTEQKEEQD
jgi:hypothetical protein